MWWYPHNRGPHNNAPTPYNCWNVVHAPSLHTQFTIHTRVYILHFPLRLLVFPVCPGKSQRTTKGSITDTGIWLRIQRFTTYYPHLTPAIGEVDHCGLKQKMHFCITTKWRKKCLLLLHFSRLCRIFCFHPQWLKLGYRCTWFNTNMVIHKVCTIFVFPLPTYFFSAPGISPFTHLRSHRRCSHSLFFRPPRQADGCVTHIFFISLSR